MTTTSVRAIPAAEPSMPLGERLIAAGLITEDQLQVALKESGPPELQGAQDGIVHQVDPVA